jgi:polyphosphate kinase
VDQTTAPHTEGVAQARTRSSDAGRPSRRDLVDHAWFDRDLAWLEFNRRVLHEAEDERTPLLERLKFLAIFGSNLDEFFMKRISVLREQANCNENEDPSATSTNARGPPSSAQARATDPP